MRWIIALLIWLCGVSALAQVPVRGYYRCDGTYVQPHYRSNPDGNPYNNWSYPGNTNPYTGRTATGNPETYLKRYIYGDDYSSSINSSRRYSRLNINFNHFTKPSLFASRFKTKNEIIDQLGPPDKEEKQDNSTLYLYWREFESIGSASGLVGFSILDNSSTVDGIFFLENSDSYKLWKRYLKRLNREFKKEKKQKNRDIDKMFKELGIDLNKDIWNQSDGYYETKEGVYHLQKFGVLNRILILPSSVK